MRVMLVGSGGREHALAWKIAGSDLVDELICVPGNAGMALEPKTRCVSLAVDDHDALVKFAVDEHMDLVVVGPEGPLCSGLADKLREASIDVMGPDASAARLEGSKVYAKELMEQQSVPTASFQVFDKAQDALDFIKRNPGPCVVKADGLAAGKGVIVCSGQEEAKDAIERIMLKKAYGPAGDRIIVEELLEGEEASCIALVAGGEILMMASSQDHKRALDGDEGMNTGGMGAYSPAPVIDEELESKIVDTVFKPIVDGLREQGTDYRGVLYAGLMIGPQGPKVLEFNVRFGDPETQVLIPRISSDLVPALVAVARGGLEGQELEWDSRPAVSVVLASQGYPGPYEKGKIINGLGNASALEDVVVFHAGTKKHADELVTWGGRVLNVCALGDDIRKAVDKAYKAVDLISFEGKHFRTDIAHRALERLL